MMEKIGRENCGNALSKVVEFVRSGEKNRLGKNSAEVEAFGQVIRVLDSISSENIMKEQLNGLILKSNQEINFLSSIVSTIRSGDLNSQIRSIRFLESIALDGESKRKIAETPDLLFLPPQNRHRSRPNRHNLISVDHNRRDSHCQNPTRAKRHRNRRRRTALRCSGECAACTGMRG